MTDEVTILKTQRITRRWMWIMTLLYLVPFPILLYASLFSVAILEPTGSKFLQVKYPKHVMLELKSALTQKKKEDLIFTNLHGQQVERTHLNNCFNRAARKLDGNTRITPKMLLEEDVEKGAASNCMFDHLSI